MFIKCIYLLVCLTYYTPIVNSMNEKEIEILWDTIRVDSDYICHEHLSSYYKDEDPEDISRVMEKFGQPHSSESQSIPKRRMTFIEFANAASEGQVHICSKQAMNTVFEEMSKGKNYISLNDMMGYYGQTVPAHQLKIVIETYGIQQAINAPAKKYESCPREEGSDSESPATAEQIELSLEYQLQFSGLRKAVNIGDLLRPLRDEIAVEKEIVKIFNGIRVPNLDYVEDIDMSNYYQIQYKRPEIMFATRNYGIRHDFFIPGRDHLGILDEYRVNLDNFVMAGHKGDIPRFSLELMNTAFMEITAQFPESKSRGYITYPELFHHYKTRIPPSQIEYIMSHFGKTFYVRERGLDFYGFRRAVNSGNWADPLFDKMPLLHDLFKQIIPANENRNHILVEDVYKLYGAKLKNLRGKLRKYGKQPSGGKNRWYFPDFKIAVGFGVLSAVTEI